MMKAALVGFGTISIVHMDAIASNPGMELVAICDINEDLAAKVPAGVKFYTDYKKMAQEVKPDVIHNLLRHYLHYPVTKELVEMGFNVFCEKPIAMNTKEAEQFCALEKAHPEVKIGVCLQNRMNETTEALKEIIASGEYGKIVGIRGFVPWRRDKAYYDAQPWRGKWKYAGGGSMINQSLHTLDLLYFLGGDIARLHAVVGQTNEYPEVEVEGDIVARLEFANGANGMFFATNNNWTNESVQIRVAMEKGIFHIEDNTLWRIESDGSRTVICKSPRLEGIKFYYGSSHTRLIARFYNAVKNNTDDYIHISEGAMIVRLMDSIFRSANTGRLVEV